MPQEVSIKRLKRQSNGKEVRWLRVRTPYHEEYIVAARALGGRWDYEAKAWDYPRAKEAEVRALCIRIYGVDSGYIPEPETPTDSSHYEYYEDERRASGMSRSLWSNMALDEMD